jgi:hypothetical protein
MLRNQVRIATRHRQWLPATELECRRCDGLLDWSAKLLNMHADAEAALRNLDSAEATVQQIMADLIGPDLMG